MNFQWVIDDGFCNYIKDENLRRAENCVWRNTIWSRINVATNEFFLDAEHNIAAVELNTVT